MKQMSFISRGHWVIASLNSRWRRQSLATSLLETGAGRRVEKGAALTVRSWLSAGISSSWRGIGLFLMLFSLSLIVGCGGGGGSSSGGDREDNRDNEELVGARWSIAPFAGGLSIEWHDLDSLNQNGSLESISITITKRGSTGIVYSINITDFVDGIYNLTSLGDGMVLEDGSAYRFTSLVLKYSDGSTEPLRITWWGMNSANNEADNNAAGIVVGEDGDGNGRADSVDMDGDGGADNNTLLDGDDGADNNTLLDGDGGADNNTLLDGDGGKGSDNNTLLDGDGGADNTTLSGGDGGEDNTTALDGDGGEDNTTVLDGDGGEDGNTVLDRDSDNDGVLDDDEAAGCVLRSDCDNDGAQDGVDVDDDGDGLIEIRNASELAAVRYQLNGNGSRRSDGGELNTLGCGNGTNTGDISSCLGYELVTNISLTDYIAEYNATAGWQPIASGCGGDKFTAIFDGNGFEVRGLFINRSGEDCVGLFSDTDGTIRHLGVIADRIIGKDKVGGLVGDGRNAEIVESYVVSDEVRGNDEVGGLVGDGRGANIFHSYAVSGEVGGSAHVIGGLVGDGWGANIFHSYAVSDLVRGNDQVGGLVGEGRGVDIIRSYAVSDLVRGNDRVGGLIGEGRGITIIQSYAVSGEVRGNDEHIGGLLGYTSLIETEDNDFLSSIVQSYAVSGMVTGRRFVGGLGGYGEEFMMTQSYAVSGELNGIEHTGGLMGLNEDGVVSTSYWDNQTSGIDRSSGGQGQNRIALRLPTGYTDIYATWDDGTTVGGINRDSSIWCDEDLSGTIEADEMRDAGHEMGDNRVWDFGTTTDYPAIRCTADNLTAQRAWWFLNATHKPQLNQDLLDAWLDGSLR